MLDTLSTARIRKLVRRDLDSGGPILLRGLLLTKRLLLAASARAKDQSGLADHDPLNIVCAAVELLLTGERRVYTYHGGLLATVRFLVETTRGLEVTADLLSEVRMRLKTHHPEKKVSGAALLLVLGGEPALWPIAEALLIGKKTRQIANELAIPMIDVILRIRHLRSIAKHVADLRKEEVVKN